MNKWMGALGGVLLLLFVLVAGCGGTSEKALSKSVFVKQGNAICAKATKAREEEIDQLLKDADSDADPKALRAEAVDKGMPSYESAAEQIADLGAPKGDEAKVEAIVDAMEEAAGNVKADPESAFGSIEPFREANKAAESYGLKDCAIP